MNPSSSMERAVAERRRSTATVPPASSQRRRKSGESREGTSRRAQCHHPCREMVCLFFGGCRRARGLSAISNSALMSTKAGYYPVVSALLHPLPFPFSLSFLSLILRRPVRRFSPSPFYHPLCLPFLLFVLKNVQSVSFSISKNGQQHANQYFDATVLLSCL